jgi:hypothetical protein
MDGEMLDAEAQEIRSHLTECVPCRQAMEALEDASTRASLALPLLDSEPALEEAARRFQERLRVRDQGVAGFFGTSFSLPRAASIALLLTAAVASALPGSPVRRWIAGSWEALTHPADPPGGQERLQQRSRSDSPAALPGIDETGAGLSVEDGTVEIWIHHLPEEAELRVLWVEGQEAWVYAGESTRFNRSEGRLEAFDPPGAVRVEIPRNAGRVTLGLDGEIILSKVGDELEIRGPVRQRTPSEIRFAPSGVPNDPEGSGVSNP